MSVLCHGEGEAFPLRAHFDGMSPCECQGRALEPIQGQQPRFQQPWPPTVPLFAALPRDLFVPWGFLAWTSWLSPHRDVSLAEESTVHLFLPIQMALFYSGGGNGGQEEPALPGVLTSSVHVANSLSDHKSDLGRTMVTFQREFSSKTLTFRGGNASSFTGWILQVLCQHGADCLHPIHPAGGRTKLWDLAFLWGQAGGVAHLDPVDLGIFPKL